MYVRSYLCSGLGEDMLFGITYLKVWDLFYDADSVRKMLSGKIQEESMRTYLFTYSNVYDSISIVSVEICR